MSDIEAAPWFAIGTPSSLAPTPLACQYRTDQAVLPSGRLGVMLRLVTSSGMWVNEFEPESALALAEGLTRAAQASLAGIIVTPDG